MWRPDNLPLNADLVRAFLRESARFALEHGRSGWKLTASALTREDFYAQTSLAIRAQLTAPADPQQSASDQAIKSQQILLLASQLEQQAQEIQTVQQSIRSGWDDLARTMGVDETDELPFLDGEREFLEDEGQALLWRLILEALLFFAPPEAMLATCSEEVLEALGEMEACSEPIPQQVRALLANSAGRLIRAPGWQLVGKKKCPADKPWLVHPRVALLFPPSANT